MWINRLEQGQDSLRRHATALLLHRRDVEEIVRASLWRAVKRVDSLSPQTDARTWMLRIMHGLLARRSWQARLRRAAPADCPVPDFHHLTHAQRAVLLLVTIEDLAYAEVAEVLGIPVGQVMSLLAEGRERLRLLADDAAMRRAS
jgi:DNA-directed RNA polymerase specialized sigma24 family protein